MRHEIFLSVLITTFNRGPELKLCLDSFQNLNRQLLERIEFVILNNGSTDNTEEIIKLSSAKLQLRSIHVQENIGFDKALLMLNSEASGKYVWFFGDRYRISSFGISSFSGLMSWISEQDPDVVTFQSKILQSSNLQVPRAISSEVIKVEPKLLTKYVHYDSLPSNISKRVMVKEISNEQLSTFIGSEFIQVAINLYKISQLESVRLGIFSDDQMFYVNSASAKSGFRFSTFGMLDGKRKLHSEFPELTPPTDTRAEIGFLIHEKLGKSKLFGLKSDVNTYSDLVNLAKKLSLQLTIKDKLFAWIYLYFPAWFLRKVLSR